MAEQGQEFDTFTDDTQLSDGNYFAFKNTDSGDPQWNRASALTIKKYMGESIFHTYTNTTPIAITAGGANTSLLAGQQIATNPYIELVGGVIKFKTQDNITLIIKLKVEGTIAGGATGSLKLFRASTILGASGARIDAMQILTNTEDATPNGQSALFMVNSKELPSLYTDGFNIVMASLTPSVSASVTSVALSIQVKVNSLFEV